MSGVSGDSGASEGLQVCGGAGGCLVVRNDSAVPRPTELGSAKSPSEARYATDQLVAEREDNIDDRVHFLRLPVQEAG